MSLLNPKLLDQYDVPGPRYTSYPTADRFVGAFGHTQYVQALRQRQQGLGLRGVPLSVYVHIPFCASLCYYCACNKIITKQYGQAERYLQSLGREIDLTVAELGRGQPVSQLHWGGGSPTFLRNDDMKALQERLNEAFQFLPGGEYSMEVDPRTVDASRLAFIRGLGFNRLSLGVQDFEAAVQKAVHRIQSTNDVKNLMVAARALGFDSVNLDLIYGLPMQTTASFERTLDQVVELRPERIALYAYAHLPERFKPQRRIHALDLPAPAIKVAMMQRALERLLAAGYVYIGMDHFAWPDDDLAVAKRQGRLHRNFQGYSTQPDSDLIALGVSAIGRVGATYSQNAKTLETYEDLLALGQLPVERGLLLSRDDLVRRNIIMALMCQGHVSIESIEMAHLMDFRKTFASEMVELSEMQDRGLVQLEGDAIHVTEQGWYFVRAVAMVFDRYVRADQDRTRFSKII
jgi:oxygen-independent coproporphyrinogen III oxidase